MHDHQMQAFFLFVWLVLVVGSAAAQIENCTVYRETIDNIVNGVNVDQQTIKLVDVGQTARCFIYYAAGLYHTDEQTSAIARESSAFADFVKRFESSRTDKQAGTSAGAASTSVTVQGPVAKSLSVAAEYGALTQSVNGQIVTLRGNLAGLPSALVRNNIFPYCLGTDKTNGYCVSTSMLSLLRRFSFGISFDASRDTQTLVGKPAGGTSSSGSAQPVTFTGKKREVAGVSGRIELWNRRDPTSKDFRNTWHQKVGATMDTATKDLQDKAGYLAAAVMKASFYEAWQQRSLDRVSAAGRDREKLVAALHDALLDLTIHLAPVMPDYRERAMAAVAAYNRYLIDQDEFIDSLARKSVLAFEYTNNRPLGQASVSNFRLIVDRPLTAQTKVVANAALTIYDSVPKDAAANIKRFRDAQAAVELDHGLGQASIVGPATISLAGYYQYQNTPALLDVDPSNPLPGIAFTGLPAGANTVFAKTGDLWLVQAKLPLAPKESSVKIPLSVTYSNRTELINKPTWRAQVGVAYDFDALFSGFAKK